MALEFPGWWVRPLGGMADTQDLGSCAERRRGSSPRAANDGDKLGTKLPTRSQCGIDATATRDAPLNQRAVRIQWGNPCRFKTCLSHGPFWMVRSGPCRLRSIIAGLLARKGPFERQESWTRRSKVGQPHFVYWRDGPELTRPSPGIRYRGEFGAMARRKGVLWADGRGRRRVGHGGDGGGANGAFAEGQGEG